MEDAPDIATFNYLKKGFRNAPTHYYLRPYSLAIERDVKNDCYLDKTEIEVSALQTMVSHNGTFVQHSDRPIMNMSMTL